ncbi:MAG: MlaD family protein [Treponema sp.]|jgi:phospholipid/cholesterol/gamma-HCH transport system substrate-binding protein|nr:MlaD family protein [Treponema sp.]
MKFSIRFADQIVGTLVILALVIVVVVVFLLGKSQRWFNHDYQYKTYFTSAAGISPNMAVQYKGFTIGSVEKIKLAENDNVEVIFTIHEEHINRVREGSMVEVQISPIGLGNSFLFYPGLGSELIPEGMVIPEVNSREAKILMERKLSNIPESGDSIGNIMNNVNLLLDNINLAISGSDETSIGRSLGNIETITSDITNVTDGLSGEIGSILNELGKVLSELELVIGDIGKLTTTINEPAGTVMSILDGDGPVFTDIKKALDALAGIIQNLEKISAFIPDQLPQLALVIGDLHPVLKKVEDVLISLINNPLLKGGVPVHTETGPGAASPRNLEF